LYLGWSAEAVLVHGALRAGGVFSTVAGFVMLGAAVAIVVGSAGPRPGVAAALSALAAVGAAVSFAGADLTTLLIGLEITALCGYALVLTSGGARASEASMKYFVQGAVATGLFVLGMAIMVGVFAPDGALSSIAAAPDAYETAEAPIAAFLAGSMKLAMIGVLASLVAVLAPAGSTAQNRFGVLGIDVFAVLGALALASIVVGSTIALMSRSYRRMLGYAGVAQVGYALIAFAALNPSGAMVFTTTYAIATTAAFLAADSFARLRPDWDGTVDGLAGMGREHPALGAAVTVALMSLAGIPPLLGFWGKLQVFGAGVQTSAGLNSQGDTGLALWLATLVAVGLIGSVVSLGYYGLVVRSLFARPVGELRVPDDGEAPSAGPSFTAVIVLAAIVGVLGFLPMFIGIPMSVSGFLLRG
jgi:NADH-quinone oxidoreductase subunit N